MTRLKSDGLIKIHYKDKLRGIRLTHRGKIYYSPCPLNGSPIILQTTVKPTAQEVTCQGDYDFSRLLSPMPCCNAQESLCIQRKSQLYFLGTRKILPNLRFRSFTQPGNGKSWEQKPSRSTIPDLWESCYARMPCMFSTLPATTRSNGNTGRN